MHRAFISSETDGRVEIPGEEAHHLVRVRRASPGELFLGLDGRGRVFLCRLRAEGLNWYGEVLEERALNSESPLRVVLGQALLKWDRFEWVLQKCTELGVSRIIPLVTARTELRLSEERESRRFERWQKILGEAVKQSGRVRVPDLALPRGLDACLQEDDSEFCFALDEAASGNLHKALEAFRRVDSCLALVGPEGGWDDRDRHVLDAHRVPRFGLGPRILRAETAPVAILAILQFALGDLGR